MKYCSECKKVFENDEVCEHTTKTKYSWQDKATMIDLDTEAVCKWCGSIKNLNYHPLYKWNLKGIPDDPSYCTCSGCDEKRRKEYERQEAMKYIIINDCGEVEFKEDKDEVEEYLDDLVSDMDYEDTLEGYLILKLEEVTGEIKAEHFKNPNNSHLVFWDNETYRVEEVIEPTVEYDGNINISW